LIGIGEREKLRTLRTLRIKGFRKQGITELDSEIQN
jgi:hypothetical protein